MHYGIIENVKAIITITELCNTMTIFPHYFINRNNQPCIMPSKDDRTSIQNVYRGSCSECVSRMQHCLGHACKLEHAEKDLARYLEKIKSLKISRCQMSRTHPFQFVLYHHNIRKRERERERERKAEREKKKGRDLYFLRFFHKFVKSPFIVLKFSRL